MNLQVTLRVTGIDLDDEQTESILEKFPLLMWASSDVTTVTMTVAADSAVEEVVDTVRAIQGAIPGFDAVRVDRDLVSITDIAFRTGVSREAARKWTKDEDFPEPFATVGGSKSIWLWTEVCDWLNETRGIMLDLDQPSEALMAHIDNCLLRNPDATSIEWQNVSLFSTVAASGYTPRRSSETRFAPSERFSFRSVEDLESA